MRPSRSSASDPEARISGLAVAGPCDLIVLDGSGSTGVGEMQYFWSSTDPALHEAIRELSQHAISIAPLLTKTDFEYTVMLQVPLSLLLLTTLQLPNPNPKP